VDIQSVVDTMIEIETIALSFSILGAVFIGRHEIRFFAFVFWIIGNVLWIIYSLLTHNVHIFILMSVYFISNVIGLHDTWANKKVATQTIKEIIISLWRKVNDRRAHK